MRLQTKEAHTRRNGHARPQRDGSAAPAADLPVCGDRDPAQPAFVVVAVYERDLWGTVEAVPLCWQLGLVEQNAARTTPAAERLRAAVLQVQWARFVEQTEGAAPPPEGWQTLVELAEPSIRRVIAATGVTGDDVDDCVQETWVAVLQGIEKLHPASSGTGIAAWLRTIARRTALRFRRHQLAPLAECEPLHDQQPWRSPEPDDPASICLERESLRQLTRSIHSLRAEAGERTYLVVSRYLAGKTNLTALAKELGVSRGRLFHCWRTALRLLHNDLV